MIVSHNSGGLYQRISKKSHSFPKYYQKDVNNLYCPECGKSNPDDAQYCQYCNAELKETPVLTSNVHFRRYIEKAKGVKISKFTDTVKRWKSVLVTLGIAVVFVVGISFALKYVAPNQIASNPLELYATHKEEVQPELLRQAEEMIQRVYDSALEEKEYYELDVPKSESNDWWYTSICYLLKQRNVEKVTCTDFSYDYPSLGSNQGEWSELQNYKGISGMLSIDYSCHITSPSETSVDDGLARCLYTYTDGQWQIYDLFIY